MDEDQMAKTNVIIEKLIDSNILVNLSHDPLSPNLIMTPNPILNPKGESHLSKTSEREERDVAKELFIDSGTIQSKYLHFSSLTVLQLEAFP